MSRLLLKKVLVYLFSAAVILRSFYFLKLHLEKLHQMIRLQEIKNYPHGTREQTTSHLYWDRMCDCWGLLSD